MTDAGLRRDLEELIEEWQKTPGETTPDGQTAIYHICANELQKVLNRHD